MYRNCVMAGSDIAYIIFRKKNKTIINIVRKRLVAYIRKTAPKRHVEKLIPNFDPGCRRIIVDPDYLSSLHRPNVELKWDAIEEIVPEGIKLKGTDGEIQPIDCIILGTGFSFDMSHLSIRGRSGQTVTEYYKTQGGPTAYLGTCMPGFPNLFTLTGPNVATGHASVIFSDEVQVSLSRCLVLLKGLSLMEYCTRFNLPCS